VAEDRIALVPGLVSQAIVDHAEAAQGDNEQGEPSTARMLPAQEGTLPPETRGERAVFK
jgi:hypothetical protein